jgi:Flp pilus assembly pilin Flp
MIRLFVDDERGAVSIDWVTLTAGIVVLGMLVVYSVMGNSAGYLMDEFEGMNEQFATSADEIAASTQADGVSSSLRKGGSSSSASAASQ